MKGLDKCQYDIEIFQISRTDFEEESDIMRTVFFGSRVRQVWDGLEDIEMVAGRQGRKSWSR